MKDFKTIRTLYANMIEGSDSIYITPNDISNPADQSTININNIAFLFYGNMSDTQNCDATLF